MSIKNLFASLLAILLSSNLFASDYPNRPIKVIVPFPPGGSVDYIARIIAPKLSLELGQPIVIENKGGASGVIGTTEASKAMPDGYTLLMVFDTHAVNQWLYKLTYDTFTSFDYLTEIASAPMLLVVPKTSPINSINDLMAYAKNQPNGITYGSSGVGGSNHLSALDFSQKLGLKATHVPYKGGGPMLTAAMAGEVDFIITSMPVILGQIKSGESKLKAIAVSTSQRVLQLPNIPTISSAIPGYVAESWVGLVSPAGLSLPVKKKLSDAIQKTLESPEVRDRLISDGFHVANNSPQLFTQKVKRESTRVGAFIKKNSIKID